MLLKDPANFLVFDSFTATAVKMVNTTGFTRTKVLIIGGGISGICMAVELLTKYNIRDIVIIEKSGGFGGTWRDNIYPGAACDVFSQLYSYSFAPHPGFTRLLPEQQEILDYLVDVAQRYGLYRYARFSSEVVKLRWDGEKMLWEVGVRVDGGKEREYVDGAEYSIIADFVVSAIGQTNVPKGLEMKGLEKFGGKVMHSARWDRGFDLKGKKVAIIGTGSTAAQIVPKIVDEVAHLTVCQRSPGFIIPRVDYAIPQWQRTLTACCPPLAKRIRAEMMNYRERFHTAVTQAGSHPADHMRAMNDELVARQLAGRPDLQEKVKPRYNPGCKRTVITSDYYPALTRSNVDLETASIKEVTVEGIKFEGSDEPRAYDMLILATGFDTFSFLKRLDITGQNGRTLNEIWSVGAPKAYKGIMVPGLPNLGILYGPNTNLSHTSLILVIEAQARCLGAMINRMFTARKGETDTLAFWPKTDVTEHYCQVLQERLQNTTFADDSCTSWWKREDGTIENNWPGTAVEYQKLLENIEWSDFEMEGTAAAGFEADVTKRKTQKVPRVVEETWFSRSGIAALALGGMAVGVGFARVYRQLHLQIL
ncbi:hypothetical protein H2198_007442 [Neophaeococcomyces mojaviensis]|uniref:Uncharacterized protein n=1 Tax=Neophaeococcomyces mojaviensis TaxID=3383035 RepID=A0ACC3A002_9EURO|nr:hypothetical protein H2198_007442 [Knufia sp. JES_112]